MEEERTTLSTSTIVSHPEHILLPEYHQESTNGSASMSEFSQEKDLPRVLSQLESELSFLMSETEVTEEKDRLEKSKQMFKEQQEHHRQWESNMNNRKLALLERVQNLKRFHKNRMGIYDNFKVYANDMHRKLHNRTDVEKQSSQKT